MIVGVNRVYEHAGREYQLQAEDLGLEQACFEVRVYDHGTVLWRKRIGYEQLIAKQLPRADLELELHGLMEKAIHTVQAAIAKGKLQ